MRRSLVLVALAIISACSAETSAPADPNAGVTAANDTIAISVNTANVGPIIPSDFFGLYFEIYYNFAADKRWASTTMVNVLKALGTGGVLRINGGGSIGGRPGGVDHTWWTPGARDVRSDSGTVLTALDFDRLFQLCAAADWKAIVGVNFGAALPDTFAAEGAFIQAHGGSRLAGIEIGNEPDLYSVGKPSYTFASYAKDLDAYLDAFQRRAPGVPITAPATSYDTAWFRQTVAHAPSRFAMATQHRYALMQEAGVPPSSTRYPSIAHLLSDSLLSDERRFFAAVAASAKAYGVPVRITELGSADLGGSPGVSDVFAAALWTVDDLFAAAESGIAGINFNSGFSVSPGGGAPFTLTFSDATLTPRPAMYGLLAFQDAAKGQVLNLTPASKRRWNLTAHGAVTATDGTVRLALVNKDTASLTVRIVVPNAKTVTVRRLKAGTTISPLSDSTGVTYAGAKMTAAGTFTPIDAEMISPVGGTFLLNMPSASAAVIVVAVK